MPLPRTQHVYMNAAGEGSGASAKLEPDNFSREYVKNGVPLDTAFEMDALYRSAMAINFSRFEGAKFNIERLEWEQDD